MIPGYTRPQQVIRQVLDESPAATEARTLHAFAFGPQFDLFRYTDAEEKAAMTGVLFEENSSADPDDRQVVPFDGLLSHHIVDAAFTRLYAENLEGQLWLAPGSGSEASGYEFRIYNLQNPNKVRVTDANTGLGVNIGVEDDDVDALVTELYGRAIKVGDVAYLTLGSETVRRMVRGIERELVASHIGTNGDDLDDMLFAASANNPSQSNAAAFSGATAPTNWTLAFDNAATAWNGLVAGSSYNGQYAERYTITVTKASVNSVGGKVRIRSASGGFSADNVSATASGDDYVVNHSALGGVIARLTPDEPYTELVVGDSFTFVVTGKYLPLALTGGSKDLALGGSSEYTGAADTRYILTVVEGVSVGSGNDSFTGGVVRVTDTAGIDVDQEYTIVHGTEYALGTLGLRFSFPTGVSTPSATHQPGLRKGDVYYIDAVSAKAIGPASIIVLSGQATNIANWIETDVDDNIFDLDLRMLFTGRIEPRRDTPPDLGWESGAAGILVRNNLNLEVAGRTSNEWVAAKSSSFGRLFAHWRGLVPALTTDTIKRYNSESAIVDAFGEFDQENPVCYSAIMAMRGAQGKSVFVGKVKTNDVAGYTDILRQASRIDGIYSLTANTNDAAVKALIKAHVDDQSTETKKLWRRAYIGSENPGPYVVLSQDADGDALTAEIQTNANGNVRVVCPEATFLTSEVRPGDLYRTQFVSDEWGDQTYDEFVIETISDENELYLVSGPASPISPAVRFEIWRPDTGLTQAEYVGNLAEAIQDRRMVTVWADGPLKRNASNVLVATTPNYLAAEVAGLRSALLPQQGLTYTELDHSVDAAPRMFTKYTDEELNVAAAHGVLIVAQDLEDGPIYIRHQLTTQTNKNALFWEDSVGANLDAVSYAFKDLFRPYIGKRNVTPALVSEIYVQAQGLLDSFKSPPASFPQAGPQIIDYVGLTVGIDKVFKDRINCSVRMEFPLPLNTLVIELTATQTTAETTITMQTVNAGS